MKKIIFLCGICINLFGVSSVYLGLVENNTGLGGGSGGILYKATVPEEAYSFLLPPGSTKRLGHWMNLRKQKMIIAALKGGGDPIFLEWGPESAGKCKPNVAVQSIIYWKGAQNALSDEKTYQTYCLNDDKVELGLRIHPNGKPEVYAIKGATKSSQL